MPDRFSSGKSSPKKILESFKPSRINWLHFINVFVNTLDQKGFHHKFLLKKVATHSDVFWLADKYSRIMENLGILISRPENIKIARASVMGSF